jgi:hypothetical protein
MFCLNSDYYVLYRLIKIKCLLGFFSLDTLQYNDTSCGSRQGSYSQLTDVRVV